MQIYRVKDWDKLYENNRSREIKALQWVLVPNGHDGDSYIALVGRENGASMFGAWIAVLKVASQCSPRGDLMREAGIPHDAESLSRKTRLKVGIIEDMLDLCVSPEIQWLTLSPHEGATIPHEGATIPHEGATIPHEGATIPHEGAPNERTNEGNGSERNGIANTGGGALDEPQDQRPWLTDLMARIKAVLGPAEMVKNHARWLKRAETERDKTERVIADTERAKVEGRIKTTPAQYAEDAWKRFA